MEPSLRTRLGTAASARLHRTTWDAEVDAVMEALLGRPARVSAV
jgi:hypothetical protein